MRQAVQVAVLQLGRVGEGELVQAAAWGGGGQGDRYSLLNLITHSIKNYDFILLGLMGRVGEGQLVQGSGLMGRGAR